MLVPLFRNFGSGSEICWNKYVSLRRHNFIKYGTQQMVDQAGRATRSTDDPLNVRPKAARLEIRKKIFSSRVTESWNKIPSYVKNVKTVSGFKRSYKKHRELVAPP